MNNVFSTNNNKPLPTVKPRWILIITVVTVALILLLNCFTVVNEGFTGIKFQFGKIVGSNLNPGLNFKIPFIEKIEQVETRNLIYEFNGDAYTKDTQWVKDLRLKVTYRYERGKLSDLVRDVGISGIQDRYLVPNVQKHAKDAIGKVNAEMLVQERGSVQNDIQALLTNDLAPLGIIVEAFAIENIAFEAEFLTSIQNKVVAAQKALEAENVTRQRGEEKKQAIIAAEARAESVRIEAEAEATAIELIQKQIAQNRQYIEYLKIINWNGVLPQVIGDGVNPFVVLGDTGALTGGGSQANNQ